MSNYTKRVCDSILPLSIGKTLPEAFEEWFFTDQIIDHESSCETCGLCGQADLRYHFEIKNDYTNSELWVGSHCILKFNVPVYEGQLRLSSKDAKKKLDKLTEMMRLNACIKALEKLANSENNPILKNALDYYRRNKTLTPRYAFVVFWKLGAHRIDHHPSFFGINLRTQQLKTALREMPTSRVHLFWSALSPSQRRIAVGLGHLPPPNFARGHTATGKKAPSQEKFGNDRSLPHKGLS